MISSIEENPLSLPFTFSGNFILLLIFFLRVVRWATDFLEQFAHLSSVMED
jgi:hypothetical protein